MLYRQRKHIKKNLKTYKKDMEPYKQKQAVVFTDYRFYFQ